MIQFGHVIARAQPEESAVAFCEKQIARLARNDIALISN
jgi:hypothetical protein